MIRLAVLPRLCLALLPLSAAAFEPSPGVKVDRFIALTEAPWRGDVTKDAPLSSRENLVVLRRGDMELKIDVYRPDDERVLPAVLMVHGGGWTGGSKEGMRSLAKALAARGWVTACASYRLAGQAPFPAAVHDVKAAVRWLREQAGEHGVDPQRVGAVGGSAGGHLVGMVATTADRLLEESDGAWAGQSSRLGAAVLMGAGVDQLARALESPKPIASQLIFFGGPVTEKREIYRQASPFHQLTKACPPLLFLDGEKDDPGARYVTMRQRMDELGLAHELAVVEGCAHGAWGKSPWLECMVGEMDRFLTARLKSGVR